MRIHAITGVVVLGVLAGCASSGNMYSRNDAGKPWTVQEATVVQVSEATIEGRDQGTVVFPNAECKIFLVASAEERARRRVEDFRRRGQHATLEEVLAQQNLRDQRDTVRKAGPLARAPSISQTSLPSVAKS